MKRVLVDSGCSIKQEETEKYNIELVPLKILIGETEYQDGINLPMDEFYRQLINDKIFPKTSLPDLGDLEEKVNKYIEIGDEVIILTISSEISGTYNAIKLLFGNNEKVKVIDSKSAVGGMRLIVDEINRFRDLSLDEIEDKVNKFIPRIKIMAIPETLEYLFRGGRLSKKEWILGSVLKIKPIIGFVDGKVRVLSKKLKECECDKNYDIIASYTYDRANIDKLVEMTDEQYKKQIRVYDNLDPVIAAHWGPNAFGYIFIGKE